MTPRHRRLVVLLAPLLAVALAPAQAQDAPARPLPQLTAKDAQNFLAIAPGELRIVGSETHYDIHLPADVLFDFDRAELRPDALPLLLKLKEHLSGFEASQVHVRGHTDSKGTPQYNSVLSMKRATAVCAWLKREVGGFTNCIGRGEDEPLLPNENADGSDNPVHRQLNRRVTVSVVRYPDVNELLGSAEKGADAALGTLDRAPDTGEMLDDAKRRADEVLKRLEPPAGD